MFTHVLLKQGICEKGGNLLYPDQQVFKSRGGKQAGLGGLSLGDGSGMTNSLAGFLLGLFLFLLGLAALFAHTKKPLFLTGASRKL
mgnify:CR=1 FL=1